MKRLILFLMIGGMQPNECISCSNPIWRGDGFCDPSCNEAEHHWDGGDCCEHTCIDSKFLCGSHGYDCQDPHGERRYLFHKKYSSFELTLLCDRIVGAGYTVGFFYSLMSDRNDIKRKNSYIRDTTVPKECQQQFEQQILPTYKHEKCVRAGRTKNPFCFDRGHIVTANHMDDNLQTTHDASYVTNLIPQAAGLNQGGGAWYATEEIIECHRDFPDVRNLDIFGGILYDEANNDYFLNSHGIPTPDTFYKIVVKYFTDDRKDPDVIAWIMRNIPDEKAPRINQRFNANDMDMGGALIDVKELKDLTKDTLDKLPKQFSERAYEFGSSWESLRNAELCKNGNSDAQFSSMEEL